MRETRLGTKPKASQKAPQISLFDALFYFRNAFTCSLLILVLHFSEEGVSRLWAKVLDLLLSASVPSHSLSLERGRGTQCTPWVNHLTSLSSPICK